MVGKKWHEGARYVFSPLDFDAALFVSYKYMSEAFVIAGTVKLLSLSVGSLVTVLKMAAWGLVWLIDGLSVIMDVVFAGHCTMSQTKWDE